MFKFFKNTVAIAHSYMEAVVKSGSIVVDATVGNGNDTLFLAKLVGQEGKVYGFDIQEQAIKATQNLISENSLKNVLLFNAGHENMSEYVHEPVDLIVFNLGYLPGGDHSIVTNAESTLLAVTEGLKILKPGGLMCIVVYIGHEGGLKEKIMLEDYLIKLDKKDFCVGKINYLNREKAPYLILVEKNFDVSGGK